MQSRSISSGARRSTAHDRARSRGDQWSIADELDRIAEPLFRMQHDRPAFNTVLPQPQRLVDGMPGKLQARVLPAPLVFHPAALEIAEQQPRDAGVEVRRRVVGPERENL